MSKLYVLISILLTGCGNIYVTATIPNPLLSSQAATVSGLRDDTPYNYSDSQIGNANCWENSIRTNGQAYGNSDNTGYLCTGGGASYSPQYVPNGTYPTMTIWLGFYRDGTVSIQGIDGHHEISNVFLPYNRIPCEMDLSRPNDDVTTYIVAQVNYPGISTHVLDSQHHLAHIEIQRYINPGVDTALDSGSIWSCELKPFFGVE